MVNTYDNALLTTMKVVSKDVPGILPDAGISLDILFKEVFDNMGSTLARIL